MDGNMGDAAANARNRWSMTGDKRTASADSEKQCNRCGERGHRLHECKRIRYVPLEIARCHACESHRGEHSHHRQIHTVSQLAAEVGTNAVSCIQSYMFEIHEPFAASEDLPIPELTRLLREHCFDKRAALDAIASMPDDPPWDRVRRDLAWSDWPAGAVFTHYDGKYGVDPLDEDARRHHLPQRGPCGARAHAPSPTRSLGVSVYDHETGAKRELVIGPDHPICGAPPRKWGTQFSEAPTCPYCVRLLARSEMTDEARNAEMARPAFHLAPVDQDVALQPSVDNERNAGAS